MSDRPEDESRSADGPGAPARPARRNLARNLAARTLVLSMLGRLGDGALIVSEGRRRHLCGRPVPGEPVPEIEVLAAEAWRRVLTDRGDGLRRAFAERLVTCPNDDELVLALRVLVRNVDGLERSRIARRLGRRVGASAIGGLLKSPTPGIFDRQLRIFDELEDETAALVLGDGLPGGIGVFSTAAATLAEARTAHVQALGTKLKLTAADDVLEVGSGWSGFSVEAARLFGCHVTVALSSPRWYAVAKREVERAAAGDLVEIVVRAPERGSGRFAKIVVLGAAPVVIDKLVTGLGDWSALLRREGLLALELAVSPGAQHLRGGPPPVDTVVRIGREAGLEIVAFTDLGANYAETVAHWRRALDAHAAALLGKLDEVALGAIRFDLCVAQAAVTERHLGMGEFLFAAQRRRRRPQGQWTGAAGDRVTRRVTG